MNQSLFRGSRRGLITSTPYVGDMTIPAAMNFGAHLAVSAKPELERVDLQLGHLRKQAMTTDGDEELREWLLDRYNAMVFERQKWVEQSSRGLRMVYYLRDMTRCLGMNIQGGNIDGV